MFGIFVNENGGIPYASAIAMGVKPIETRSRNMLGSLVGQRVAVIRTRRGKRPTIVGYADIVKAEFCPASEFDRYRIDTLIPEGSAYDVKGAGKWFYYMANPAICLPHELPADAIRHGRSYCEF